MDFEKCFDELLHDLCSTFAMLRLTGAVPL